jgi:hypothetical protein
MLPPFSDTTKLEFENFFTSKTRKNENIKNEYKSCLNKIVIGIFRYF